MAQGLVAALCMLTACYQDPSYDETRFRCDLEHACPDGLYCVDQLCSDRPRCKASELRDDFNDGIDGSGSLYGEAGATSSETGGFLVATPASGTTIFNSAGYKNPGFYDLSDDRFFVEVVQVTNTASNADTSMAVISEDGETILYIEQERGKMHFEEVAAGIKTLPSPIAYDTSSHRWWQLRESGGNTYWETSVNGQNWITQRMEPSRPFVTKVQIKIYALTYQSETDPGIAEFDNLNGGNGASGSAEDCP